MQSAAINSVLEPQYLSPNLVNNPLQPRPEAGLVPTEYPIRSKAGTWTSFKKRYQPLPREIDQDGYAIRLFEDYDLPAWAIETEPGTHTLINYRHIWSVIIENNEFVIIPGYKREVLGYFLSPYPFDDFMEGVSGGYRYRHDPSPL